MTETVFATPGNADFAGYGKEMLNTALLGAGLTAGGTALYHLLHGFNSAKLPALVRDSAPAVEVEAQEKAKKHKARAAHGPQFKFANNSATDILNSIYTAVGKAIPQGLIPAGFGDPTGPGGSPASINPSHQAWRNVANYAALVAGGAGGAHLVNSIADKKRKQDVTDDVEDARREYFAALTGKSAELDAAYETASKSASQLTESAPYKAVAQWLSSSGPVSDTVRTLAGNAKETATRTQTALTTALLASTLGAGGLGAKYMYDQTKARSRAENLRRAAASRARLKGIQQTPWIDPDALAAISGNRNG
jgi:hypothetical protein